MKSTFLLFMVLVLSFSQGVRAQITPGPEKKISPDLTAVEEFPKFPGNVNKYLADNIHYPADAIAAKKEGKVYTKFVVTATGEVTDIKVVKGVYPSLDAEAVRVLRSMPKWTPGKNRGKAVDVALSLPISFVLENAKQQGHTSVKSDAHPPMIYTKAEQMPEFEGGVMNYLMQNLQYPADAKKNGTEGKVILRFVVDASGNVNDVTVVKTANPLLDEEAVRVVKSMPRWKAGRQNGKAVSVYYTLPISFRLNNETPVKKG